MSGIMMLLLGRSVGGAFTEYKIFTASGNWTAPTGVTQVEYLVVAGGAGGGSQQGGGGGAGGFRTGTGFSVRAASIGQQFSCWTMLGCEAGKEQIGEMVNSADVDRNQAWR